MSKPDATPGGRGDVGRTDRGAHATPVSRGTSSRWEEVAMMWMFAGFRIRGKVGAGRHPPDRAIVNVEETCRRRQGTAALKEVLEASDVQRRRLWFRLKRSGCDHDLEIRPSSHR